MTDKRMELFQNVVDAILSTPGETPSTLRATLIQQPAHLYGLPIQQETTLPPEMKTYVTKVATNAYKVTDQDIAQLRAHGYGEDAIFEITLSVAAGAGMMCLKQGLAALEEAKNAPEKD
jgi:alkylhydroperoxidase family enzyme